METVKEWFSLAEIADLAAVPKTTATRYAAAFRAHMESRKFGRRRKYRANAAQTLQAVYEMYTNGLGTQEIADRLAEAIPGTIEVESGKAIAKRAVSIPALLGVMAEDREDRLRVLAELKDTLQEQRAQLERLTALLQRPLWQRLFGRKAK